MFPQNVDNRKMNKMWSPETPITTYTSVIIYQLNCVVKQETTACSCLQDTSITETQSFWVGFITTSVRLLTAPRTYASRSRRAPSASCPWPHSPWEKDRQERQAAWREPRRRGLWLPASWRKVSSSLWRVVSWVLPYRAECSPLSPNLHLIQHSQSNHTDMMVALLVVMASICC